LSLLQLTVHACHAQQRNQVVNFKQLLLYTLHESSKHNQKLHAGHAQQRNRSN